jgi:hypothetical protein
MVAFDPTHVSFPAAAMVVLEIVIAKTVARQKQNPTIDPFIVSSADLFIVSSACLPFPDPPGEQRDMYAQSPWDIRTCAN